MRMKLRMRNLSQHTLPPNAPAQHPNAHYRSASVSERIQFGEQKGVKYIDLPIKKYKNPKDQQDHINRLYYNDNAVVSNKTSSLYGGPYTSSRS